MQLEEHRVDSEYVVPAELIDQYAREGAVLIPQPFDRYWIDGLLEAFEEMVAAWEAGRGNYSVVRKDGSLFLSNAILRHPFYRRWAIESPAASIVGQVTKSDTVRFYFDNFFCKEGGEAQNATSLHHDIPVFGFQGTQLPSFWLALSDVDEDNAPLVTYVGSQGAHDMRFRSRIQKPGLPLLPGYREWTELDAYLEDGGFEQRVWTARKGDVVIVGPHTIHGSLPRLATSEPAMRIGFSSRWMGDDVRWHGSLYHEFEASIMPEEPAQGARPSDELFPVVWQRGHGNLLTIDGPFNPIKMLESHV